MKIDHWLRKIAILIVLQFNKKSQFLCLYKKRYCTRNNNLLFTVIIYLVYDLALVLYVFVVVVSDVHPLVLCFRVKYYPSDPLMLKEELTRLCKSQAIHHEVGM